MEVRKIMPGAFEFFHALVSPHVIVQASRDKTSPSYAGYGIHRMVAKTSNSHSPPGERSRDVSAASGKRALDLRLDRKNLRVSSSRRLQLPDEIWRRV
jgi:hypothetical protein